MELRGPHTIHPAQCLPPHCCQEKRLQCPVKTHTERVLQGENGRRSTLDASLWSSEPDHMLPFLKWNTDSAMLQGRSACSWAPHLGLENSLLSCWPLNHRDYSSIVFWKHSVCQDDRCPSLGLHWWQSTSSFLFEEDMRRVVPGNSEIRGGFLPDWLWLHLNLFSLLTVLLSSTLPSRACLFPFLYWPEGLILSYSAGCQHYDSMSSVYPSHFAQLPDEWDSL